MKKKILFLFVALFTALFFFDADKPNNKLEEDTKVSLLADGTESETVDLSVPRKNSEKPYESNIPDSWYDESIDHGIFTGVYEGGMKSYVDLISLDGSTNYFAPNNVVIPGGEIEPSSIIINAVVGQEFGFYLETAYTGFYREIYDHYDINFELGYYDLEITNSYYSLADSTTYSQNLFSTIDSPDVNYFYKSTDTDGYGQNPLNIEMSTSAERNEEFRLDKFVFTPTTGGISTFSIRTTDLSNGVSTYIDIIICIAEEEGNELSYGTFFLGNDNGDVIQIGDVKNLSGDAILTDEFYQYYITYLFLGMPALEFADGSGLYYDIYLSNITTGLELSKSEDPRFTTPTYEFVLDNYGQYSVDVTIMYKFKYMKGGSIAEYFDFKTFKLRIEYFEDIKIDCGAQLGNNTLQFIQNEEYDLRPTEYSAEKYDITYTMDGVDYYTSKVIFSETGTKTLTVRLYDKINDNIFYSDYTIIVVEDTEYYQTPKFNTGSNPTVDVEKLASEGYTVAISNYEYLNKNASLKVEALSDTITYEFVDNTITLTSGSVGANKLNVIAIYPDKVVSSILTINVVSKYEFALDKAVVEMDVNSEDKIRVGFVNDGIFTSLNENEDYYILVSLADNEITATLNSSNEIVIASGSTSKQVTGTVVIIMNDIMIEAFNFTVIVGEDDVNVIDTEIDIVEGSTLRLLLGDKTASINVNLDPIVSGRGYDFDWISLNNKVASVLKTDELSAKITGVGVGTTEIIAICQTEDGSTITARATIIVLDTIPEVYINVESLTNTNSALTIYDLLSVSINNNGFNFSSQISIEWYIDDQRITTALDKNQVTIALNSKQNSFYYKLSEGLHNIKAVITDDYYGFEVTATKEINISPLEYQERQLSFTESEIKLVLTGTDYKLDVLLDGAINTEYTYLWSIDDSKVVSIEMSSGASAIIKPMSAGETYINAFTNIGKYEDRIIRTQIKVIVEALSTVDLVLQNEFNKPGDTVNISVLINGKTGFKNFEPNIEITSGSETIDYTYENGVITLEDAKSGNVNVKLRYGMNESKTSFEVTSFNIKEFILIILPYLIIALVITVALFTIFKVNNNPFKKIQKAVNNLDKQASSILLDETEIDEKTAKKIYAKLLSNAKNLSSNLHYFYDEGIDEFKHTISNTETLIKILIALIHSPKSDPSKIKNVINNIKNNQIKTIIDNVNEIINSRIKYQENIKKIMSQGETTNKKGKKKKIKAEDYHQYLIEKGIIVYDEEIPDDDDEDNN